MKAISFLAALCVVVCLIGCENTELVNCQQSLEQATATIAEKDSKIEALKVENTDMQTKAMENITTMMQKQDAKDKQVKKELADTKEQLNSLKAQLADKENLIKELSSKIAEHKCPVPEAVEAAPAVTE